MFKPVHSSLVVAFCKCNFRTFGKMSYLINDPKYSWLKEIGIQSENLGAFSGTWSGNGEVCSSVPHMRTGGGTLRVDSLQVEG